MTYIHIYYVYIIAEHLRHTNLYIYTHISGTQETYIASSFFLLNYMKYEYAYNFLIQSEPN